MTLWHTIDHVKFATAINSSHFGNWGETSALFFALLKHCWQINLRFQMIVQTSEVQSGARVLNLAYNSIQRKLLPGTLLQQKLLILLSTWKGQTGENLYRWKIGRISTRTCCCCWWSSLYCTLSKPRWKSREDLNFCLIIITFQGCGKIPLQFLFCWASSSVLKINLNFRAGRFSLSL